MSIRWVSKITASSFMASGETNTDILGIQETKVEDNSFPINEITEAGFFCEFIGQKTYNGVTTISKVPPKESVKLINGKEQEQKDF